MDKEINSKKRTYIYIGIIILLIIAIIGVSFAFFNYTRTGPRNILQTGNIVFNYVDGSALTLSNQEPIGETEATTGDSNKISFSITSHNTLSDGIKYSVYAVYGDEETGKTRFPDSVVSLKFVPTADGDGFTTKTNNYETASNLTFTDGKALISTGIVKDTVAETTKNYEAYIWIDETKVFVSSTTKRATLPEGNPSLADATTGNVTEGRYIKNDNNLVNTTLYPATAENVNKIIYTTKEYSNSYYSIKIVVEAEDYVYVPTGSEKVLQAIETNATGTCQDIIYEEDGIKYFSGTNDCINFNYVWYSGKLWRITAIYPDGTMKMITEDALTTIYWGSTVEYDGSWIYQWLNEDFYDTLVNPSDIIVQNSVWNYSTDGNDTPVKPETIATQKTKEAPVGLLNAYEYYNAYRKVSYRTGYLNIGYYWWLITPYSTSVVRLVNDVGSLPTIYSPSSDAYGVRPSINLKSGLEFAGTGTKSEPFKIVGDKENPANGTLISSRSVGEYVKFDNDLYRIVSIDTDEKNGTITKLTRVDYLKDNGTVITKNFASTAYFGKSTNTQEDTFWDYYLNNTWYNNINTTYKNMLVDGIYYLGLYPSNKNYKATTCKDTTLDSVTTKNCTKYTSSDADKTFTGKVGLPRVGEMFSSQLGSGKSSSSYIWIITPRSTSLVRNVGSSGYLSHDLPSREAFGVRPSINLKSGIKITGGTGYVGGDTNSPFEISE